jgi:O-antigen/teichoic acid export membrane protein
MNRILKNFGVVLRGKGIAGLLAAAATALMANALSAREFGLVILLHTYVVVVRGLLNFRTFEAVVRFGVPHVEEQRSGELFSLLRVTQIVDIAAAFAAFVIAAAAAPLAAHYLQWDPEMVPWAIGYSVVALTTANGTSNGLLRVYDRFDALSVQFIVAPALRLLGVAAAWLLHAPMWVFILAWGGSFACGHLYMLLRGLRELRAQTGRGLWAGFRVADLRDRERDFWKFLGVVYWQTNIDMLPKHVSTLLAGALLGPAAAGLFRLAREFSTVLTQPAVMLRDVLFPDLTRRFHSGDQKFLRLSFRTALLAGAAGLLFALLSIVVGPPILRFVGEDYVAASMLVSLLLLAATFELAAAALRTAAYAMGRAGSILRIHVVSICFYLAAFFGFTWLLGLNGPGYAAILASLLSLFLTARLIVRNGRLAKAARSGTVGSGD